MKPLDKVYVYKGTILCDVHAEQMKQRLYKRKGGVNGLSLKPETFPQGPYHPWAQEFCEECRKGENKNQQDEEVKK